MSIEEYVELFEEKVLKLINKCSSLNNEADSSLAIEILLKEDGARELLDEYNISDTEFYSLLNAKVTAKDLIESYKVELSINEQNEKVIDRMIDYIMIHQQVKTMRKIFCKHCELKNGCTYSGIHRNCVRRYFEYVAKQGNINEMHNDLELLEGDEEV